MNRALQLVEHSGYRIAIELEPFSFECWGDFESPVSGACTYGRTRSEHRATVSNTMPGHQTFLLVFSSEGKHFFDRESIHTAHDHRPISFQTLFNQLKFF